MPSRYLATRRCGPKAILFVRSFATFVSPDFPSASTSGFALSTTCNSSFSGSAPSAPGLVFSLSESELELEEDEERSSQKHFFGGSASTASSYMPGSEFFACSLKRSAPRIHKQPSDKGTVFITERPHSGNQLRGPKQPPQPCSF